MWEHAHIMVVFLLALDHLSLVLPLQGATSLSIPSPSSLSLPLPTSLSPFHVLFFSLYKRLSSFLQLYDQSSFKDDQPWPVDNGVLLWHVQWQATQKLLKHRDPGQPAIKRQRRRARPHMALKGRAALLSCPAAICGRPGAWRAWLAQTSMRLVQWVVARDSPKNWPEMDLCGTYNFKW